MQRSTRPARPERPRATRGSDYVERRNSPANGSYLSLIGAFRLLLESPCPSPGGYRSHLRRHRCPYPRTLLGYALRVRLARVRQGALELPRLPAGAGRIARSITRPLWRSMILSIERTSSWPRKWGFRPRSISFVLAAL